MTTEWSNGKARTVMPRSSAAPFIGAVEERPPQHGANGQFVPGNRAGADRAAKQAIAKTLGLHPTDTAVSVVARDARKVASVVLRDLPSDAFVVRNLVTLLGRHSAIAAYLNVRADELGLDTPAGRDALELALRHGARVERLTVTALDLAARLAKAPRRDADHAPWFVDTPAEDTPPSEEPIAGEVIDEGERSDVGTSEGASDNVDASARVLARATGNYELMTSSTADAEEENDHAQD